MEEKIVSVILAGGSGTRLWPISRDNYPKQFCYLTGKYSLLQQTVTRSKKINPATKLLIVTSEKYYFLCKDQLTAIGINDAQYILEPCAKDTAAAITLAALYAKKYLFDDAKLLIFPSDHYIADITELQQTLSIANTLCNNKLITFGIKPRNANPGYGYIEQGTPIGNGCFTIKRFIEKPTEEAAAKYLEKATFYWNSGMFLFNVRHYLDEISKLAADIYNCCLKAFINSQKQHDFFRIANTFTSCKKLSIDYALMEKTNLGVVLPLNIQWSDLGSWNAIAEFSPKDSRGNVMLGNISSHNSANCMIKSTNQHIMAIGIKNHLVISTKDALLIAEKSHEKEIKKLVTKMQQENNPIASEQHRNYRPWGFFEELSVGIGYKVKYIWIKPYSSLSLQMHKHRSEHWVVVSGIANVINGAKEFTLNANQSTFIPCETKHRLSNDTAHPLVVIEVQSGSYLAEDDILRFEDCYGRTTHAVTEESIC